MLQGAIAIQNDVPNFRRAIEYRKYSAVPFNWLFHTSYGEGWALYAEALGEEMGVFCPHPAGLLPPAWAALCHKGNSLTVSRIG